MKKNHYQRAFNRLSGILPNIQKDLKKIERDFACFTDGTPEEARRAAFNYFELLEIEIQQAKKEAEALTFD